jgi:hypothetical protein
MKASSSYQINVSTKTGSRGLQRLPPSCVWDFCLSVILSSVANGAKNLDPHAVIPKRISETLHPACGRIQR